MPFTCFSLGFDHSAYFLNPCLITLLKQLKAYAKAQGFNKSFNPYKAAYGSMPSHASANPEIKQLYINGLGIIRHISFYNKDFKFSHPDIVVKKKSDSPDKDKCVHGSELLISAFDTATRSSTALTARTILSCPR